ncbi:MAG: DUF2478 domain-containing protein [Pseudomonadota bacterium]
MMALATVTMQERGATDRLLARVAAKLSEDGMQLRGALRDLGQDTINQHCQSALRLLPDGPLVQITQDLGPGSAACKMDAGALEDVVGMAVAGLNAEGADLVVLNKFGLREAEGHGFRPLIAEALGRDIPVLIGVSDTHRTAFERFADGLAASLPGEEDAIVAWCRQATGIPPATTEQTHQIRRST